MASSGGGGQGRMWLVNSKCAVDGEDGDNEYLLNPMTLMMRCTQFSEASLGPSPASVLVTISRASLPSTVSQQVPSRNCQVYANAKCSASNSVETLPEARTQSIPGDKCASESRTLWFSSVPRELLNF